MDRSVARGSSKLAPVMMIVGAAAVLLGSALPWFSLRADFSSFGGPGVRTTTANGLDTSDGTLFLIIAIGIAVLGVVALVSTARGTRLGVSIIAAIGSLFVLGFGIYDALTPKSQAVDEASKELGTGVGAGAIRRFIEGLFDRGFITIGVEIGLWIVIVGAAVALIGSLMAAVTARAQQAPPSVAPAFAPAVAAQGWAPTAPSVTPSGAPVAPDAAPPTPPSAMPGDAPPTPGAPMAHTPPPEAPAGPIREDTDQPPGP
jgi:hypothetical protein